MLIFWIFYLQIYNTQIEAEKFTTRTPGSRWMPHKIHRPWWKTSHLKPPDFHRQAFGSLLFVWFWPITKVINPSGDYCLKKKYIYIYIYTSQIGERKIIFKHTLGADTLVPRRVDTKVIILPTTEINVASSDPSQSGYSNWIIDWYNGHEEDIRGRCSMWRVPFKALPRLRSWSSTTGTRRWKEDDFQAKISPC